MSTSDPPVYGRVRQMGRSPMPYTDSTSTAAAGPQSDALDAVVRRAAAAAPIWGTKSLRQRGIALVAVADALGAAADELVALAMDETGLSSARLTGELLRTRVQLQLFADTVV